MQNILHKQIKAATAAANYFCQRKNNRIKSVDVSVLYEQVKQPGIVI